MKDERFNEYHKHGCYFSGKLVVVNYTDDMHNDPKWGKFGAGVTLDYIAKAKELVKERQYNVVRELLSVPDYVVEVA